MDRSDRADPGSGGGGRQAHETSGLTSRLILAYAERAGGEPAVEAILNRCGLAAFREELCDESFWFDFPTKVALLEAAAVVLDDPQVPRRIGAAAVELNAMHSVKLLLRTVGTPRLGYLALPRVALKFTWTHRLELLDSSETTARFRYTDAAGVGYHRADCEYTQGMLSCLPTVFGALPGRVRHPECALRGDPGCVYDVRWEDPSSARAHRVRRAAAVATAALVSGLPAGPRPLRRAAGVSAAGAALLARRALRERAQRVRSLESEVRDQRALGGRLLASLRDLVGELRAEEVLDKIVANAAATIPGREFALLVVTEAGVRVRSSSDLPSRTLRALEAWANGVPERPGRRCTLDDLSAVPELAGLTAAGGAPLGALHSSPLGFRDETMGALVTFGHGADGFAAQEIEVLAAYADQAAIALANARLFARVEDQARRDSLTGLLNAREFDEQLARHIARAERSGGTVGLIMLDLDGFKRVNDECGHAEGDRVLRLVAEEIVAACRSRDSAHRIGGDEFAVVLPGAGAPEAAEVVRRLEAGLGGVREGVSASCGVAVWPEAGPSQSLLTFNADRALYETKARRGDGRRSTRPEAAPRVPGVGSGDSREHYLRRLATTLARAVDAKDSYTRSHSETVSELCVMVARELGLDEERVSALALAGLLHDVGKIGIPDSVLQKPGRLTDEEYALMQSHSTLGHSIVAGADLGEAAHWILHHHERVDGRGYPDRLAEEEIPIESRIILVSDAFEAMTSDRPYRARRPTHEALTELDRHVGTQFDPRCVRALRRALGSGARELFAAEEVGA